MLRCVCVCVCANYRTWARRAWQNLSIEADSEYTFDAGPFRVVQQIDQTGFTAIQSQSDSWQKAKTKAKKKRRQTNRSS